MIETLADLTRLTALNNFNNNIAEGSAVYSVLNPNDAFNSFMSRTGTGFLYIGFHKPELSGNATSLGI